MKRVFMILLAVVFLSGCAACMDILDILADDPKPAPVCDVDTVGIHHQGQVCLKYDDGQYRWSVAK